jgi:hypothetical protein
MKFETMGGQQPERVPGMGERLAKDFLVNKKLNADSTREALERLVDRTRSEYLMHGRVTGEVPSADELTSYITTQYEQLPKSGDPGETYAWVADRVTDFIKRKQAAQALQKKKAA